MHPDNGLRKARTVTVGIAAASVAGVLVVAGIAHQATAATNGNPTTPTTTQPTTTSDNSGTTYPPVTSGNDNTGGNTGSVATSGGS